MTEQNENGIAAYDLERPAGMHPAYAPYRHPGRIAPLPRYTPPPVPGAHARVKLDDDYYLGPGWRDWAEEHARFPSEVFDIPAQQRERWQAAQEAYATMQEEISALMEARAREPGAPNVPPGWVRVPPYQPQP